MQIAVLALQGAFIEHEQRLQSLGARCHEVRQAADWEQPKDGLIIPGGESTTIGKLLDDLDLTERLRDDILQGLPVFGTCAGLIVLARQVERGRPYIGTMHITACRNAYGRQLGSFHTRGAFRGLGDDVPMTFIRAPYICGTENDVEVLAEVDGKVVAAQQGNQLVTAFHPELDGDTRIHEYFLEMVRRCQKRTP